MARAAPWALATTWSRSFCSPAGLALAARTTTSLLNIQTAQFQEEPRIVAKNFKLVLAGTALGALISSEADCMPQAKKGLHAAGEEEGQDRLEACCQALATLRASKDPGIRSGALSKLI